MTRKTVRVSLIKIQSNGYEFNLYQYYEGERGVGGSKCGATGAVALIFQVRTD